MTGRVLIAYATKYGSTKEIAEFIGEKLNGKGIQADVSAAVDADSLASYDLVIIGSPVYTGKWLSGALNLVKKNREELSGKKVALFSTGLTMNEDTPENRETLREASAEVREIVSPVSEGLFAGRMEYKELSIPHKIMIKAVKAPEGDFRDWKKIEEWALSLAGYL